MSIQDASRLRVSPDPSTRCSTTPNAARVCETEKKEARPTYAWVASFSFPPRLLASSPTSRASSDLPRGSQHGRTWPRGKERRLSTPDAAKLGRRWSLLWRTPPSLPRSEPLRYASIQPCFPTVGMWSTGHRGVVPQRTSWGGDTSTSPDAIERELGTKPRGKGEEAHRM